MTLLGLRVQALKKMSGSPDALLFHDGGERFALMVSERMTLARN